MKRALVLKIIVFLLVGEAVVRFDQATLFFSGTRDKVLENIIKWSPELESVENGGFVVDGADLRIMLLGDSKLYGRWINSDSTFSKQLKSMLLKRKVADYDSVYVLDVTLPGGNTCTNKYYFYRYYSAFRPQIVILGYNYNDVYGDQDEVDSTIYRMNSRASSGRDSPARRKRVRANNKTDDPWLESVKSVKKVISKSRLIDFLLVKLNMELKLAGIVIPGTEFDHLIHKSHSPGFSGWRKSQASLREISDECKADRGHFIIYVTPSLEMLSNYQVYDQVDAALTEFCDKYKVDHLNGIDYFVGGDSDDYALSRYDGHPNEAAHRIMAQQAYDFIAGLGLEFK
ncbi:MAG TPA: hypothetical protein ENL08_00760 [Bacteroidetes bacterium]|nr:hypothetical protein [Bacteroidota bacterium]